MKRLKYVGVITVSTKIDLHLLHHIKGIFMSFYSFITNHYDLSIFFLPKEKPTNDTLNENEMKRLKELIEDNDFYEINSIIRHRYSQN